jgi:hypothetical protein
MSLSIVVFDNAILLSTCVADLRETCVWCSSPSKEDIAFAANLAAYFSKARTEGKVEVVKASVSDLKKPTGAAPGKVRICIWSCEHL